MPISMLHQQYSSNYTHFNTSAQARNVPPFPHSSNYSTIKDDRYPHIPTTSHETHLAESYPGKTQYDDDPHTLKYALGSDHDASGGGYHLVQLHHYGVLGQNTSISTNHHSHSPTFSHCLSSNDGNYANHPSVPSYSHPTTSSPTHSFCSENLPTPHAQPRCATQPAPSGSLSGPTNPLPSSLPTPAAQQPSTPSTSPQSSPDMRTSLPALAGPTARQSPQPTPPKLRPTLPNQAPSSPPGSPISSTSSSPRSSPPSSPRGAKRRRSDQERREKHNDTERKGRQKINKVLKSLLPELQNSAAPKVSVLQCAVDTIKRRTDYANSMQTQNAHLRDENKNLRAEIMRLQHLMGMSPHLPVPPLHASTTTMETLDAKRHDAHHYPGSHSIPTSSPVLPSKQWYCQGQ